MLKRIGVWAVLVILLVGGTAPAIHAQSGESLRVLALESAQAPVEAWAAAFAEAGGVSVTVEYAPTSDAVLDRAAEANVLILDDVKTEPAIAFECGFVSRAYMLLPDLGARVVASNSCGGAMDPLDEAAGALAAFMTGPDGQQIAIDLGLLPAMVEVVDQTGATVSVPQPVRRIASPYSVATYYVYSVGAGDRLVAAGYLGARDPVGAEAMRRLDPNFDTVMNAVSTLNQQEANIEELAALQPDLLLTSARTDWLNAAGELGLPVIRFEGESPELLKGAMTLLGAALGPDAAHRAALFNAYYDDTLAEILAQTQPIEPRTRVLFTGTDPLRVASGAMYQTTMVEAAGGESVSAELSGFWNDVNLEQVAIWNPDAIFYPPYGGANREAFTESAEWAIIPAVEAGRVYGLPKLAAPWDTPVPDSILGIIWMAETLYPDQVALDCASEAITFYNLFYDYAMSEDEAQELCQ